MRGFRVTLITSQFFEAHAREAGLEFLGLGSAEDYQAIINNPNLWDPEKGFRVFAESVVFPIMRPVYDLISGFDPARTVLAAQGQVFGAHIAHEKLGYPFVTINLTPAVFRSVHDFPLLPGWMPPIWKRGVFAMLDTFVLDRIFAPEINRFRKSLGLPPVRKVLEKWTHSPQLSLGLFPDWFAPPQPDWPPQTQLTGFIYYDRQNDQKGNSERLEELLAAGSAPIIFTPGTAMKHAQQFFADCTEACQMLGRRGILLTQHAEQLPRGLPADIQHFTYLPFSTILPRAAALVHHGGIGTIAQALAAGIPQVMRPTAHDQPDNAARVERLGIGKSLSPRKFNASSLARELDALATSEAVLAQCKTYAQMIDPERALDETCAVIQEFAHEHPQSAEEIK
jgi:rhamnosyltransferase subunit B